MDNSVFSQNKDILNTYLSETQEVGVIVGNSHNLDKLASSLSLYLTLKLLGKNVQIISKSDPIVEHSNLVGIDKIKKSFDGLIKTFTISLPYKEGEIEKVSYKEEGDRLNLDLQASESGISFTERDIRFIKKGSTPSLLFAVGVPTINEFNGIASSDSAIRVVNVDNNVRNEFYGDVVFVDGSFSSLSEIISKLLYEMSWPIDIDIAQNLMDGLSSATGNFNSPSTSVFAFEAAAFLMKNGARRKSHDKIGAGKRNLQFGQKQTRPMMGLPIGRSDPLSRTLGHQQSVDPLSYLAPQPVPQGKTLHTANDTPAIPEDWLSPKVFRQPKNQQGE